MAGTKPGNDGFETTEKLYKLKEYRQLLRDLLGTIKEKKDLRTSPFPSFFCDSMARKLVGINTDKSV